jgi:hypothetical protein
MPPNAAAQVVPGEVGPSNAQAPNAPGPFSAGELVVTGAIPPGVPPPPPSVITLVQPANFGGVTFPPGQQVRVLFVPPGFVMQPGAGQITLPIGSVLVPVGQPGFAPITIAAPAVAEIAGIQAMPPAATDVAGMPEATLLPAVAEEMTAVRAPLPAALEVAGISVPPVLPSTGGAPSSTVPVAGTNAARPSGSPIAYLALALALAATAGMWMRHRATQHNK